MLASRHRATLNKTSNRAVALLVLVAFLLANFPIPLPSYLFAPYRGDLESVASPEDPSQTDPTPFPCQNGHCGCSTARKCWTDCCCHTPSQRRQWAERRGITPPDYAVLNEPKQETPTGQKVASCCSTKLTKAKVEAKSDGSSRACCPNPPLTKITKSKTSTVLSIQACKCRGSHSLFTSLPWYLMPKATVVRMHLVCVDELLRVQDVFAQEMDHRPPTPPPRGV